MTLAKHSLRVVTSVYVAVAKVLFDVILRWLFFITILLGNAFVLFLQSWLQKTADVLFFVVVVVV